MADPLRILIFGAGAVGQAVGAMLAAAGHRVDLIVRPRFVEAVRLSGIRVEGIFGEFQAKPGSIGAYAEIAELPVVDYDYVIVTTKSYDTGVAVSALSSIGSRLSTVVSMQNGCGNVEMLSAAFGEERTLGARVITGYAIPEPGLVNITVTQDDIHIGGVREGEIPRSATRLAEALNQAGMPCVTTPNIHRDLYAKLLYNCALNPLGAALGVHYGALGDDPNSRLIMDGIIDEVFAVLGALEASTHWETPQEYRDFFYGNQLPATYNHRSSMLQDLEAGKRTEIDALTGFVCDQAEMLGLETPYCWTVTAMIRFLEGRG